MCLWAIYIFPRSICLFCCRKIRVPTTDIENIYSQTQECGNCDWGFAIPRKGIHKWCFRCSVTKQMISLSKKESWKKEQFAILEKLSRKPCLFRKLVIMKVSVLTLPYHSSSSHFIQRPEQPFQNHIDCANSLVQVLIASALSDSMSVTHSFKNHKACLK